MPSRFFVTGTDTGVGKTIVSALLCAALEAIYWKPIQTGARDGTDGATVMRLAGMIRSRVVPEVYRFVPPVSPHLAARRAGVRIELRRIALPHISLRENLIVEGAGGVLVPINDTEFMTNLMQRLRLPIVLVSRTSVGTINHTLLAIAALRDARLDLRGVVMVGKANAENHKAVEHYGCVPVIGRVPVLELIDRTALVRVFGSYFDRKAFDA
jgi:dethiobiotin synthetase